MIVIYGTSGVTGRFSDPSAAVVPTHRTQRARVLARAMHRYHEHMSGALGRARGSFARSLLPTLWAPPREDVVYLFPGRD